MQSQSLLVNLVQFLAIQPRDIAEVSTSVCFVVHSILILCLPGCHTRYYANYYVQRNKVTQITNQPTTLMSVSSSIRRSTFLWRGNCASCSQI